MRPWRKDIVRVAVLCSDYTHDWDLQHVGRQRDDEEQNKLLQTNANKRNRMNLIQYMRIGT